MDYGYWSSFSAFINISTLRCVPMHQGRQWLNVMQMFGRNVEYEQGPSDGENLMALHSRRLAPQVPPKRIFRSPPNYKSTVYNCCGGTPSYFLHPRVYPIMMSTSEWGRHVSICWFFILCDHTPLPPHQPCHPSFNPSCHHVVNLNFPCSHVILFFPSYFFVHYINHVTNTHFICHCSLLLLPWIQIVPITTPVNIIRR